MCTMMFLPETLPAEKRSTDDSRLAVDRLMEYDRKLSEDFTVEELQKLFPAENSGASSVIHRPDADDYTALTEAEKTAVKDFGFVPPEPLVDGTANAGRELEITDRRRWMKAKVIAAPVLCGDGSGGCWGSPGLYGPTGNIFVWLDNMSFGNSDKKGFYYVRDSFSLCWGCTTAYAHPVLIVQKKKLRPDQIWYMERKCRETLAAAERQAARRPTGD